jgi:type II secretory pathway pseudopilin PulG
MVPRPHRTGAYTLLEVLLALGVVAVLLGISVPYLAESFGKSPAEEKADEIAQVVQAVRSGAMEQGEARRIALFGNALVPETDSLPPVRLAKGWQLEVRRMTESKFRKPEKHESWGFNSAGICEPLTLRIVGGKDFLEMAFDPLTGLVVDE